MRRMTRAQLGALLLLTPTALAPSGCGGDGTTVPPDERGTIEVVNESNLHVFTVEPRRCGTTVWDLDLLSDQPCTQQGGPDEGCIAPSASRQFVVEAACYDLRADLADIEAVEIVESDSIMDLIVQAGGTATWTIQATGPPPGPQ